MINWLEIFFDKLTALEEGQKEIHALLSAYSGMHDVSPYGDFTWLTATCTGVPTSTLRVMSSKNKIPGKVKFGKRVLYEKEVVLNWLRSQTQKQVDPDEIKRVAEDQISHTLAKKEGK